MKKSILAICAALLPLVGFSKSDRYIANFSTNEFKIAYSVSFSKGEKPEHTVYYHYSLQPGVPESKWFTGTVVVRLEGISAASGRTTGEAGCYSALDPSTLEGGNVVPGVNRRIEIVHKDGFVAVYQEIGGKMVLCTRTGISSKEILRAVSFKEGQGKVCEVKLSPADARQRQKPYSETFKLPTAFGAKVRFGVRPQVPQARILLSFPDGSRRPPTYSCYSFDQKFDQKLKEKKKVEENGVPVFREVTETKKHVIKDSGLELYVDHWDRNRIYSIARIGGRYRADQMGDILKNIDAYGRSSIRHAFLFEIRRGEAGCELWIDHNFVRLLPAFATEVVVSVPPESKYKRLDDVAPMEDSMKLALAVPKAFDTSVCKVNLGSYLLECDGYLSRSPHDRLPDSFLRRVPVSTYKSAIVRCRVDPASSNTCELTARLSNFECPHNEGRSPDMITWQTKTLKRVKGEQTVVFEFEPGKIQDLIHDMGYQFLDFELLGGLDSDPLRGSPLAYLPSSKPSGVTVLAVELVRAPASLRISNGAYGNVFVEGESASVTASVAAVKSGSYNLQFTVKDVDGNVVEKSSADITLSSGGKWQRKIEFKKQDIGWYSYDAILSEKGSGVIVRFPGSYTVIAEDTRKAGYESPFFTWSGLGKLDTNEFRRIAAFLKKIGVRRTQLRKYTEEDAKEFGLTLGECYAIKAKGSTQAEKEADFERQAREAMAKWPHIDSAIILHEWYGSCVSTELYGGATKLTPQQQKTQDWNVQEATWRAKIWRKVAPHVKLKVGNAGNSLSIMSDLFRGGYSKDLIDWIGEEGVGQMETPERSTGMAFRNLKDLAEIYGYTNGVAACYEWKSRRRCLFPNARKQAAWFVRDVLIALAWRSPQVTVETGAEIGNSYFNTPWGSGAFTHGPVMQPLPHISAIANLTRMMDRCTFQRLVPTGSQTVYLLEFRDSDGKYVYAAWTARGELEARFKSEAKNLTVYDMYGREDRRFLVGKFKAKLSEEPAFFWMDAPIVGADGRGVRRYPWEVYPGLEKRKTLAKLESLDGWSIDTNSMWRLEKCQWSGLPGSIAALNAAGAVEIKTTRAVPHHDSRCDYGFIRPERPISVPEGATTLTLDVKGNSTWGKVMFEIEDSGGRRWLSAGPNADYHDLSDTMALNYDGWHTLQFQICWESPAKCFSLGSNMRQWYFVKGKGKREITYPVKVSAIGFKLSRRGFDLLNWTRPESDAVCIRNLSAY